MITVEPTGRKYAMQFSVGEEKVTFVFTQLTYFQRNIVANKSTSYREGKGFLDVGLAVFYNIKYGLKDVKGLCNLDGSEYQLQFEDGADELTDACIDGLLALNFQDKIIYATRDLGTHIPTKIVDPITGKEFEGIEVISPEKLTGVLEKKS